MERELHRPFPHQPPFTAGNLLGVYGPAMTSKPDQCSETTFSSSLHLSLFLSLSPLHTVEIHSSQNRGGLKEPIIKLVSSAVGETVFEPHCCFKKAQEISVAGLVSFQPFDCAFVETEGAFILQSKSSSGEVAFSLVLYKCSSGGTQVQQVCHR